MISGHGFLYIGLGLRTSILGAKLNICMALQRSEGRCLISP